MPTPAEITRHHPVGPPEGQTAWVRGKGPSVGITVEEPNARWPDDFSRLARRIVAALGPLALRVEHIGSTAVPALPAKPVIDIDLTVPDPADEVQWLPPLEQAGFELVIREPWWHEHRMLEFGDPRCNLHVFGPRSPETIRHQIFRDWLRGHPEDMALYRDSKLSAADESNAAGEHVMDYNARKEPVIHAIYNRAFQAAGLIR